MPGLEISEARGNEEAARLTAGRTSLQSIAVAPGLSLVGAGSFAAALNAAATVGDGLLDVTVEATTLGAIAITNAVLDAADADR